MKQRDEEISAWIDGALNDAATEQLVDLAAQDVGIDKRAQQFRRIDELIRATVPEDPLTPELLERLGLAENVRDNVVDFADAQSRHRIAADSESFRPRFASFTLNSRKVAAVFAVFAVGLTTAISLNPPDVVEPQASYRVLGDTPRSSANANALVIFDSSVSSDEARSIASSVGGSIIGGPTSSGAWKLAIAPGKRDAALALLRKHGDVSLAEPLNGGPR